MAILIEAYFAAGLAFSLWFVRWGAGRLDPVAAHSSLGFRLAILPGAMLLWPYLAVRIVRGGEAPPTESNAHRAAAGRPR